MVSPRKWCRDYAADEVSSERAAQGAHQLDALLVDSKDLWLVAVP